MFNEAQMDYMKAELADMIRFWKYDNSGEDGVVKTKFFDLEESDEASQKMTYDSYNEAKIMPQCGQLAIHGPDRSYTFRKVPSLMTMPEGIPDKISIKHSG